MSTETCCACSGEPVARVLDGSFRKPVCASHRRLYSERGYLIDAYSRGWHNGYDAGWDAAKRSEREPR